MRKLFFLATLCLVLVAVSTPVPEAQAATDDQPAELSILGGGGGSNCLLKKTKAATLYARSYAICNDWDTRPRCDEARQEWAQAEYESVVACGW